MYVSLFKLARITSDNCGIIDKIWRKGEGSMGKVFVCDHPLIQHKLTYIRDANTTTKDFRELVDEVATLMAYEITRDIPLEKVQVKTPVATAECKVISGRMLGLIPILRAGLGMVDGILNLVPAAKVGHIGLYRDPETLEPVEYYAKLPTDVQERELIVIDPMLATGGSANAAIAALKARNCTQMKLMCLIAAPEGIQAVQKAHPDIDIYVAAIDDYLDSHGYIIPGLGDAGDRLFGTK
ncbi:MAG: uracil phosphoribosyltransferase [Paenibacillus sp.]|nr:uracil phosphoribosyltransferase [Paenibacillus sp.]